MKPIYSKNELKETLGSKIYRWITLNFFNQYTLKSNDGRRIFVDAYLGIIYDKDTLETLEISELKGEFEE